MTRESPRDPRAGRPGQAEPPRGAAASQVALAWVLAANPNVVVIPGTTRLANLKSNLGAADIALTAAETASLDALAGKVAGTRYDARGMTMVNA